MKFLAERGVPGCIAPTERFDSESLLELPELAADRVKGKRVAIFRGDGGRELLAENVARRSIASPVTGVPGHRMAWCRSWQHGGPGNSMR